MARLLSTVSHLTLSLKSSINHRIENSIRIIAGHVSDRRDDPHDYMGFALAHAPAAVPAGDEQQIQSLSQQTKQLLDDLFGPLFAVPKKYVTLSVRKRKRSGLPQWAPHGYRLYAPKLDIVACQTCGHYHELRYLCEKCYERVKQASKAIQEAMAKQFEAQPVDKEVAVRYRGEDGPAEDNVRIVEVDDERPEWFSQNLLSKPHRTVLPSDPASVTK